MTKSIKFFVSALVLLMSSSVFAKVIILNPKQSQQFTNHFVFTINATCNIKSNTKNNKIKFKMINNTGKINGKHLNEGQTTSITVVNNGRISVSAEPGSAVSLVNMGSGMVQASCSA